MKNVLVIVPFAMSDDNLQLRQLQLQGLQFGDALHFDYRTVKAGPLNYSSQHDFVGRSEAASGLRGVASYRLETEARVRKSSHAVS